LTTRKLAVIALDGASPELVERWAEEGHLPHLAGLIERGAFGPLKSVVPPVTGAAWGSFLTGVNPGRHGVFEWLSRREGSYHLKLIDSSVLPRLTLFEWLSKQGIRVGAVGVPLTYPICPVEGFVISDLLTPPGRCYAHPPELQGELEAALGRHYPLAPPPWPGRRRAASWISSLKDSLRAKTEAACYLATHRPWDFFMVHVMETDSVQHQMWHLLDGNERQRYSVKLDGNPILEIYQLADRLIGQLLAGFADDTIVLVISDHGFGPLYYNLHLNTWLLRHGFLKLKGNLPTRLKRLLFEMGLAPENLYPWEERLGLLGWAKGEQAYRWLSRFSLSMQNIEWEDTVAYSYGNVGQIYLNLRGREPQGVVTESRAEGVLSELEGALREWTNPLNGERVIAHIYRREELYPGALERAPELIFLPRDGYSPMGLSEFLSNRVISYPVAHSGWHRMEGLFVGAGGPLRRGPISGLKLLDLFPTICELLGVSPPSDLDGRLIGELLDRVESRGTAEGELSSGLQRLNGSELEGVLAPAETEEAVIRERLKGLGYL